MGLDAMILVFQMLTFKPTFSLSSFTFIKRLFSSSLLYVIRVVSSAYLRLLIFLPAILIPLYLSSGPVFLMMYSAYKLNKQGDNIQPWLTPFPIWNQSIVPCLVLTVASWLAYRFLKRQVRWSDISIFLRIFQFIVIHTFKGFDIVIKQKWMFFWHSLAFLMIQKMLAIWSLVHLPFLKPAGTSESSWFMYCWSLAWRILSITLLACEMSAIGILWPCLSLGLEWKLTFSSPVATVDFSRFADILSAALSQHHLFGFEIAHLGFHHLHYLCS